MSVLFTCRPLLIFAACAVLFHFANAAMLPLVGQKLALQDRNSGTSLMSACIVAAQIVMVPMALLVGAKADSWGRKPLFLGGLLVRDAVLRAEMREQDGKPIGAIGHLAKRLVAFSLPR